MATRNTVGEINWFAVAKHGSTTEAAGSPFAQVGHRLVNGRSADSGVFAGWRWDGTRLTISNDRYGFSPLFWSRMPDDGVCVSPSLVTLIEQGTSTDLDVEALSVFFKLGFFIGDDTPFAAIKAVPPNARFEWQDGKLECRGNYPQPVRPSTLSRDDAIDRYSELFAQAMARRAPVGRFALPISGGRDSRHILLELHRTGHRPDICVSIRDFPPDSSRDPEIAAALCAELGFEHVTIGQRLPLMESHLRWNRETDFCYVANGWFLAMADYLGGRFECLYDGIAGDTLSQSSYLTVELRDAFRARNPGAIRNGLAKFGFDHSVLRSLLRGPLRDALDSSLAMERLSKEIERHLGAPNPIASFVFWNRTRRKIALNAYAVLRRVPRVYSPFLDHDLFDFLMSLPADVLADRTFHDDTIARTYPRYAHVPYAGHEYAAPAKDRRALSSFASDALRRFMLRRPSSLTRYAAPRMKMLACALSGGRISPYISPLLIYVDQLERLMEGTDR